MEHRNPHVNHKALAPRFGSALKSLSILISLGALFASALAAWGDDLVNLKVTKIGRGGVVSNTPGIDCGAKCKADFPRTDSVLLTATPTPGWTVKWGSPDNSICRGNTTPVCSVSLNNGNNKEAVIVNFEKKGFLKVAMWDYDKKKEFLVLTDLVPDKEIPLHTDSIPARVYLVVTVQDTVGAVGMVFSTFGRFAVSGPYVIPMDEQGQPAPFSIKKEKGRITFEVSVFTEPNASAPVLAKGRYVIPILSNEKTLQIGIVGNGKAKLAAKGTTCDSLCKLNYVVVPPATLNETLTAVPDSGWSFAGWQFESIPDELTGEECPGLGPCTVPILGDMLELRATFTKPDFLTVSLWDLDKNQPFKILKENPALPVFDSLLLDTLPKRFTIMAKTSDPVGSIKFMVYKSNLVKEEYVDLAAPFQLIEDSSGKAVSWTPGPGQWGINVAAMRDNPDLKGSLIAAHIYAERSTTLILYRNPTAIQPGKKTAGNLPTLKVLGRDLELSVAKPGILELTLLGLDGRSLALEKRMFQPGSHILKVPSGLAGKGIRFLRITGSEYVVTRPFLLMEGQ